MKLLHFPVETIPRSLGFTVSHGAAKLNVRKLLVRSALTSQLFTLAVGTVHSDTKEPYRLIKLTNGINICEDTTSQYSAIIIKDLMSLTARAVDPI